MFKVTRVQVVMAVEEVDDKGKVMGAKDVPIALFEAQFEQTIQSLVDQLLVQANGSPEPQKKSTGGRKKK